MTKPPRSRLGILGVVLVVIGLILILGVLVVAVSIGGPLILLQALFLVGIAMVLTGNGIGICHYWLVRRKKSHE